MQVKTFEIRDAGTFIPCIGISMTPEDADTRDLLARAGYRNTFCVLFGRMSGGTFCSNPAAWEQTPRAMPTAHKYVEEHWHELRSGQVIDVEQIAGPRPAAR
jgi:hypothetical protein